MQAAVDADLVSRLAQIAGFDFAPDRCALLAPQLERLLQQAAPLRELLLDGDEPALVFDPDAAARPQPSGHQDRGPHA